MAHYQPKVVCLMRLLFVSCCEVREVIRTGWKVVTWITLCVAVAHHTGGGQVGWPLSEARSSCV